jgi:hypothetical protein
VSAASRAALLRPVDLHPVVAPPAELLAGNVVRIPLTKGAFALVDLDDYPKVAGRKWHLHPKGYARHSFRVPNAPRNSVAFVMMHQLILGVGPGQLVDHENRCRTDNRRENLRLATHADNSRNRSTGGATGKSGYRGVTKSKSRWVAKIRGGEKGSGGRRAQVHLGSFDTSKAAADAYDRAALRYFGPFCVLNDEANRSANPVLGEQP